LECSPDNGGLAEKGLSVLHLGQEQPFLEYQVRTVFSQHKMTSMIMHILLLLQREKEASKFSMEKYRLTGINEILLNSFVFAAFNNGIF